jgi:hypothetical protein
MNLAQHAASRCSSALPGPALTLMAAAVHCLALPSHSWLQQCTAWPCPHTHGCRVHALGYVPRDPACCVHTMADPSSKHCTGLPGQLTSCKLLLSLLTGLPPCAPPPLQPPQGMTLDKVVVDLRRCFSPGQAYVALSRCRTLEGLQVVGYDFRRMYASSKVGGGGRGSGGVSCNVWARRAWLVAGLVACLLGGL